MSERERGESGQFVETVTLEDVLAVFDWVRGPAITSSDVADELECTTEAARQKLTRLYDQGKVDKRKTGRTVVYWRIEDGGREERPDAPASEPEGSPVADETTDSTPEQRNATAGDSRPLNESGGDDVLGAVEFPQGRDREACEVAVYATRDYLREYGPATMRELVTEVMPTHPLGYDAEDAVATIEAGDRYRGAWWRRVVKPGLEALDDIEPPPRGGSKWSTSTSAE